MHEVLTGTGTFAEFCSLERDSARVGTLPTGTGTYRNCRVYSYSYEAFGVSGNQVGRKCGRQRCLDALRLKF